MISLAFADKIATITLDRPQRRNALTPEMLALLCRELGTVRTHAGPGPDDCRALVVAGSGPAFCSGFDLDLCKDRPDGSTMRALLAGLSAAISSMRACDVPVVVAAHGAAIAGGCALLGGADFVVADSAAKFGYPVVKLGVSPAVSVPFLRQAVGDSLARERTLDTALILAPQAHAIGLVTDLVAAPADVLPAARALAATLAAKPHHGLRATRRWLDTLSPVNAAPALGVSLALTGGEEERLLLPLVWSPRP